MFYMRIFFAKGAATKQNVLSLLIRQRCLLAIGTNLKTTRSEKHRIMALSVRDRNSFFDRFEVLITGPRNSFKSSCFTY